MTSSADLRTRPMAPQLWPDVVALFGTRGDPSWCWCQFFLTTGQDYSHDAADNQRALKAQVDHADRPPGLVAYAADEPVGWVQFGPRTAFPRITAARGRVALAERVGDDLTDPGIWSVTCFVVKVGHRRRGVGRRLLADAVTAVRSAGANAVEGHPVDVAARASGKAPSAELFHGVATTFAAAGFVEVGRTAPTRPVMRRAL